MDHGLLRKNEKEEVCSVFGPGNSNGFDINFICVDARDRYFSKLAGVTEPERKRKIIGEEFIRVFEEQAKQIGKVDFLAQGTIYPDVVESGLGGESTVIKSHHNVGGLPDTVDFKELVEPLRNLFKDEVRQVGRELGLPEYLVSRQPFPGPGLGIRIIGEVTPEKVAIVQDADAIWREEIAKAGLDKEINQYYAALTNMRSVGVMGDERTYDYAVALRLSLIHIYLISEVQKVYRLQGVEINDKHIEVIVRQMCRKVRVTDSGSSNLIGGALASRLEVENINADLQKRIDAGEERLKLVEYQQVLLGITKAARRTMRSGERQRLKSRRR